jgi:hypothetical protein
LRQKARHHLQPLWACVVVLLSDFKRAVTFLYIFLKFVE